MVKAKHSYNFHTTNNTCLNVSVQYGEYALLSYPPSSISVFFKINCQISKASYLHNKVDSYKYVPCSKTTMDDL